VCTPKPTIQLKAVRSLVNQIDIGVNDPAGLGLSGIRVTKSVNARVNLPANFDTHPMYVLVTASRIDPTKSAQVVLEACNGCCCVVGDPVLTTLRIPEGRRRFRDTFANIPESEHYLTVQNGRPGLLRLGVNVNGVKAGNLSLRFGETRMLDLVRFMLPEKNIVTLTGEGLPGRSALVLISDVPGLDGAAKAALKSPEILWEPGPWHAGDNPHWGR
jgi:hypothetical protein